MNPEVTIIITKPFSTAPPPIFNYVTILLLCLLLIVVILSVVLTILNIIAWFNYRPVVSHFHLVKILLVILCGAIFLIAISKILIIFLLSVT